MIDAAYIAAKAQPQPIYAHTAEQQNGFHVSTPKFYMRTPCCSHIAIMPRTTSPLAHHLRHMRLSISQKFPPPKMHFSKSIFWHSNRHTALLTCTTRLRPASAKHSVPPKSAHHAWTRFEDTFQRPDMLILILIIWIIVRFDILILHFQ